MKKIETTITRQNGGLHSPRAYKGMVKMLNEHTFERARLYHLVLMGSDTLKDYQDARKAICFELERKEMPVEWKACAELDPEKGLHYHVFFLVEALNFNPCSRLNSSKTGWLTRTLRKRGLTHYLAAPRSAMHKTKLGKTVNYASVVTKKLADCEIWISYLAKNRSKSPEIKHTYFSSRPTRRKAANADLYALSA